MDYGAKPCIHIPADVHVTKKGPGYHSFGALHEWEYVNDLMRSVRAATSSQSSAPLFVIASLVTDKPRRHFVVCAFLLRKNNGNHRSYHINTMIEWLLYGLLALISILSLLIISPRFKGSKNAPPLVTSSSIVPIPLFGVIAEFFKSPNNMIKRCYKDYGPVFTIPVRT